MKLTQYHKQAIINSVLNDLPEIDKDALKAKAQADLVKGMSRACKAIYKTSPTALATVYCGGQYFFSATTLVCGDADHKTILKPHEDQRLVFEKLKANLTAAISGLKTRKQFIDTFPEFSAYAPSEHETCATLPAVANVVAGLVKAGWKQKVFKG